MSGNSWSEKIGITVDYRCMDGTDALNAVKEGKADAVGGLFFSPEREKSFGFSPPFFTIITIQKPFTVMPLSEKVRTVLDSTESTVFLEPTTA